MECRWGAGRQAATVYASPAGRLGCGLRVRQIARSAGLVMRMQFPDPLLGAAGSGPAVAVCRSVWRKSTYYQ